jgi:hypothetical protein
MRKRTFKKFENWKAACVAGGATKFEKSRGFGGLEKGDVSALIMSKLNKFYVSAGCWLAREKVGKVYSRNWEVK